MLPTAPPFGGGDTGTGAVLDYRSQHASQPDTREGSMATEASPQAILTDELREQFARVSTATVAHTLQYVPMREDLQAPLSAGQNAQRRAVESLAPGEVLIIEARGESDAGTIGDIFVRRALRRGAAGVVTDGALRDTPAIRALDLPVYHRSSH